MNGPSESYLKVAYDLRPAKQVERRMMFDAFRLLSNAGLPISSYRYTGFGSVHFVDFVMVHKLLGITKLTSVEYSEHVSKRVKFNKPYGCVDVKIAPIADVIPSLSRDEKHILWLDYDDVLCEGQLQDVWQAAGRLSVGSILLVTVDAEPPGRGGGPKKWKSYYESVASAYLSRKPVQNYARSRLALLNAGILAAAIESAVSSRPGVEVIPLFSFLYADGHEMLTIGCLIGDAPQHRIVLGSGIESEVYFRKSLRLAPYQIRVPVVTRKERVYLDRAMPCSDNWSPKDFEMTDENVAAYREIYRFMPSYAELLF